MSNPDVRQEGNKFILITYLILLSGIMNIFNPARKFVCIWGVVEKTLNLPLLFQWLKFCQNLSQFPDDLSLSDSTFDLGEGDLTIPVPFSSPPPQHNLQKQVHKAFQRGPQPWVPTTLLLACLHSFAGYW